jgi:hypothetical protein
MQVVVLNWLDYLGRGAEYVEKMRNMVARHLTIPHDFVEVTERDLPPGRAGWFNKLHLLEMFDGEVLFLDLDLVINRNIDHLVARLRTRPDLILARDDYSYPVTQRQSGREATINSSVMLWSGRKDMSGVTDEMIKTTHGDQGIITQLFWPHGIGLLPPDSIKSYKYHTLQGQGIGDICVFHGNPKPHELRDQWILDAWQ